MPHIHYEEHGAGEPTLLIQGGEGSLLVVAHGARRRARGRRPARDRLRQPRHRRCRSTSPSPTRSRTWRTDALDLLDALGDRRRPRRRRLDGRDDRPARRAAGARAGALARAARAPRQARTSASPAPTRPSWPASTGMPAASRPRSRFCRALAGSRYPFDEGYYRRLCVADEARGVDPSGGHGHALQTAIVAPGPARRDRRADARHARHRGR